MRAVFVRVVDPSSTIFCCRRWDRIETLSTPQPGRLQVLGTSFPPYYTTQPAAIGPRTGCVRILPGRGSTEGAEGCVRSSWCSLLIFVSNRPTTSSSAASVSGGGMDPGGWMRGTDRSTNNRLLLLLLRMPLRRRTLRLLAAVRHAHQDSHQEDRKGFSLDDNTNSTFL